MMKQDEDERSVSKLHLPSEIWTDIIPRLPLPSLCHFRCASKTWKKMISALFYDNVVKANSSPTNVIILGNKSWPKRNIFMAEFYVTRDYLRAGAETSIEEYDLSCEYKPVASCNGLVILNANQDANPMTYFASNPIIGQYVKLPLQKYCKGRRYFCGFGFCPSTELYKIIQFYYQIFESTVIEVHTLGTNTWRDNQSVPPRLLDNDVWTCRSVGTYLDGALYWMVIEGEDVFIYCFDLVKEQFSSNIDAQEFRVREGVFHFGATGGHLYISIYLPDVLDVFLMKDFRSSWTKVLSISIPHMYERLFWEHGSEVIKYADGSDSIILGCYETETFLFHLMAWKLKADFANLVGVKILHSRYSPVAYVPHFTSLSDAVPGLLE